MFEFLVYVFVFSLVTDDYAVSSDGFLEEFLWALRVGFYGYASYGTWVVAVAACGVGFLCLVAESGCFLVCFFTHREVHDFYGVYACKYFFW